MTPYKPGSTLYAQGDICAILDSPSVPVYLVLTGGPPPRRSTSKIDRALHALREGAHKLKAAVTPRRRSRTSLQSDGSTESFNTDARPALVLQDVLLPYGEEDDMAVMVCLLATFHGTIAREDLPLILRHFCIPVSPHPLATGSEMHIHTMPQWQTSDTWIIAIPFQSKVERISGRWIDRRTEAKPDGSFKLNEQARVDLMRECEAKRQEWERRCQKEGGTFAKDVLKEYDKYEKKAARKAAKSGSSRSSFGSARTADTQTTDHRKSDVVPAAIVTPQAGTSSGTPHEAQVAELPFTQDVLLARPSGDGDVQETPARPPKVPSPSVPEQAISSDWDSSAESVRARGVVPQIEGIVVKLPSTSKKSLDSDSNVAGSEGSGSTKQK